MVTYLNVLYIFSMAFQLTGAVLLISNFIPTRKEVIQNTAENEPIIHWVQMEENGNQSITYSREEVKRQAIRNYNNFYALMLIIIGYLIAILGEEGDKFFSFVFVIIVSGVFFIIGKCGCSILASLKFKQNETVKR